MTELDPILDFTTEILDDCKTVVAIKKRSGRCEAVEFIETLDDKIQARLQRYFQYLADGIRIKAPENFRQLERVEDKRKEFDTLIVAELKPDKYRIYLVNAGNMWLVTHAREKPKDNRVPQEITKALEIYYDWKELQEEDCHGDLQDE